MNHDWKLDGPPAIKYTDSENHTCRNCSLFRSTYSRFDIRDLELRFGLDSEKAQVFKYAYRRSLTGGPGGGPLWVGSNMPTCIEMQMDDVLK